MKTPNQSQIGEPSLTIEPANYAPYVREDRAFKRKRMSQQTNTVTSEHVCTSVQSNVEQHADLICSCTKQKVRALTELIVQLPEGAVRAVVSESFTAIINGEGDIRSLRALTISAARQLRTMYLSGGRKVIAAETRWAVREFALNNLGILLSIGPRGLHLGEGETAEDFNAFLKIDANGQVWAGETYEDAAEGPLTEPLTTEDVLQRLSEKLLLTLY